VSPLVVSAFMMGLFGGAHCVAMCGGVVGVLCSAAPRCDAAGRAGSLTQAPYWLAYNLGRVACYTLLGALMGALGSLSLGAFPLDAVRFSLRALAAVCMLAVGLHLLGLPSAVKAVEALGAPVWSRLSPLAKRMLPLRTPFHAVVLGGLWGFMPCGLLYGALALAASAESASAGAMTMAAFGAATLPVMLGAGAFAQRVSRSVNRAWVRRAAGVVVLGFGVWSTAGVASQLGVGAALGLGAHHHACCPTR
jgi:sulfite exporter TauE/SafE